MWEYCCGNTAIVGFPALVERCLGFCFAALLVFFFMCSAVVTVTLLS